MKKQMDDYNWEMYTTIYAQQTKEMEQNDKTPFLIKNSYVENNTIVFKENINDIWKALYNTIIKINPTEIFECGCGPAQHLYNIKKLNNNVNVYGCELLESQLNFGKEYLKIDKSIYENILQVDLSVPNVSYAFNEKYEFVYTQAVLMHLNYDKAKIFLTNMANLSSKYLCIFENPDNHNFDDLLNDCDITNFYKKSIVYESNVQHRIGILLEK